MSTNPLTLQVKYLTNGFLTERMSRNLSSRTIEFYSDELRYFTDLLSTENIGEITSDTIRKYLLKLSASRNGGGCHAAFRSIKAFLNWFENEYEPENWKNPIRKVKPPENKIRPLPGVSIPDIQKMISTCDSQRDKTILLFLLDTGVRASELIALNYSDVNVLTGSIIIQHGKGDKRRIVFIGKKTIKELRKYLDTRIYLTKDSPLFATEFSTRLSFSGLRQIIRRRSEDANLDEPGLHDFRRAFAVNSLKNGCDLISLSRLLGHSSVVVTQRYIYQDENDLQIVHSKTSPVDAM